jgi:hypothetical protein
MIHDLTAEEAVGLAALVLRAARWAVLAVNRARAIGIAACAQSTE